MEEDALRERVRESEERLEEAEERLEGVDAQIEQARERSDEGEA